MFENSGFVTCPCCGQLLEIYNNGIMGFLAYLPVSNCDFQKQINAIRDCMANPTMSMRDQWEQTQNNRSNLNYSTEDNNGN